MANDVINDNSPSDDQRQIAVILSYLWRG